MGKAMDGIPAGLRDKMMGDAAKEVTLIKGEMRTVAGVLCQNYTVTLGEKFRLETCVTTSITPPFDPKNFKNLTLLTAPFGGNGAVNKLVQKMREIDGFSLSSSTSLGPFGKRIETATEATEIRRGPIEDRLFDLPPGFKKVNSPFTELSR